MIRKNILDGYDKQFVITTYLENKTLEKTGAVFGVSIETLRKYFIKNKIMYDKRQKYDCNHNFFSLDTEASFYWAGFIAADGNIEKEANRIKIELALDDYAHLEKFKIAIESTAPIHIAEKIETRPQFKENIYYSCKIRFNSEQMVKDLLRFNIVANKSKIYDMPDWLFDHPLLNHFIRGLIDGDGWSYIENGASEIGLSGSHITINKIINYLNIKINSIHTIERDTLSIIRCTNLIDNTKIINFLLKGSETFLDRKHDIQLQILQIIPRKINVSRNILENMLKETPLIKGEVVKIYSEMAKKINVSPATIKRRLIEFDLYHPINDILNYKIIKTPKIIDREANLAYAKQYYQNNKEELKIRAKEYRITNKEKRKLWQQIRRSTLRAENLSKT